MSKPTYDSDLYGDIYGDEEQELDLKDAQSSLESSTAFTAVQSNSHSAFIAVSETPNSLPPKPSTVPSNAMSYSAQIAKQFSAYQQTPTQERQQRKELPLPQNPMSTHGNPPTVNNSDGVFGKKPSEMHDAGKLFIGGLNWETTDEGLRDYFSQFGKVDACTIMRDPSGTSRGFAFLTFEDPSAVDAVVGREHVLDGKSIDPKRAIPREEHLRNTRYFVGGLAATTTSESMRNFFSVYGKIVDATVMVDRDTGRSKGFGFVTFEDSSNSDQFVGKLGLILDDKEIEVKVAQPRSQRDQNRNTNSAVTQSRDGYERESRSTALSFTSMQQNPMSMLFQRSMGQIPMIGGNIPMMNMNPISMMGGINGFNSMGGINTMGMLGNMNSMGGLGVGSARLGMGPMGSGMSGIGMIGPAGGNGMNGMNGMGMGMRPGLGGIVGVSNGNFGRALNTGPGPARMSGRGQHNFHPYSR
ncbi:hypothetical protein BDQ17DRAFT_1372173 [Cyathus striatus]|nr:hypothetical protein BDQ17DRAFT_1372173 [Cyathus striatus]